MQKKTVFMVGMPYSGKTTYLVSLCRLLILGEQETVWKLDEDDMPGGIEKIKDLISQLESYRRVDSTLTSVFYDILFPLSNKQQRILYVVPDLSGEIFCNLVYDRRINRTILKRMEDAETLLFFVNTDTMIPETRLGVQEISAIKKVDEEHGGTEIKNSDQAEETEQLWEKRNNQSAVVELLQCIVYLVKHSLNIKFIVSAWDLVEKKYGGQMPSPEEYVKKMFPLLHQYVFSNPRISYEYWGVSAQGGDFEDERELLKLQGKNESVLAYIVDPNMDISKDLTKLL